MKKTLIRACLLAYFFLLCRASLHGQDSGVSIAPTMIYGVRTSDPFDLRENNPLVILDIPIVSKKFYSEFRYNYDQMNTFGFYAGRLSALDKKDEHVLIPQIGVLYGDYKGISLQLYYQLLKKHFEVNFQNQYGVSFYQNSNFYFNWSDIQLSMKSGFRPGGSIMIYLDKQASYLDLGLSLAYKTENWTVALYSFNFYDLSNHYFFFGLQRRSFLKSKRTSRPRRFLGS